MALDDTAGTATLTWTPYEGSAAFEAYWVLHKVQSSALDGTDVRDTVTESGGPRCICLDVASDLMYWIGVGTDCLYHAHLDGSHRTTLVEKYNHLRGLALVPA